MGNRSSDGIANRLKSRINTLLSSVVVSGNDIFYHLHRGCCRMFATRTLRAQPGDDVK